MAHPRASRRCSLRGLRPLLLALAGILHAPGAAAQYQLVWHDEFDGTAVDPTKWEHQLGTGCPNLCGWGNNELQFYRAENATVSGGLLTIRARRESFGGRQYTSARLRTRGLGEWLHGRFEIRARLPVAQGMWPAFWMLPSSSPYGGWAASGEIDVVELVGSEPSRVHGTIHYGGTYPANTSSGAGYTLPSGTFADDFHVFALEWEPGELRWYVDDVHYSTKTSWWSSAAPYPAPFDQPFHLLLNLAVGGDWPGPPGPANQFPQDLVVDWVRVYQDTGAVCDQLFDDMEHGDPLGNGWFLFSGPGAGGGIGADTVDVPPLVGGSASLSAGWGSGGTPGYLGGFGRTWPMDVSAATHFELWIRPDAGQEWELELNLQDDDDGDGAIPSAPDGADDEFQAVLSVGSGGPGPVAGGGWQHVVVPLADFVDDDSFHFGGNGVFDPVPAAAGGNGALVNVVAALRTTTGAPVSFRTDQWRFTRRTASLTGRVHLDVDGNGSGSGDPGLPGVAVELEDAATGASLGAATTGADGTYRFDALLAGPHRVRVVSATLPPGVAPTADPDGVATPHAFDVPLACDEAFVGGDLGYSPGPATVYCLGAPNSAGPGAVMTHAGSLSIGAANFELLTFGAVPGGFGLYFCGTQPVDLPFGNGRLCVGGDLYRLLPAVAASPFGAASRTLDFASPPGDGIAAGSTWYFQFWYRDLAAGTAGFNTSDALAATFVP